MKIGAIIQARTSSTRLPQKVLKQLPYGSGITVLQQVIRRVKKSTAISHIIVATTKNKEDIKIVEIAKKEKVLWFRGSKEDVLSRYYSAAKKSKLDIIVRITSDCPCIDPAIIDLMIEKHLTTKSDYTSNSLKRTFPHGLDTEVISFHALEKAYNETTEKFEKEHVSPYIYKTKPNLFKISSVEASKKLAAPDIRITLDTEEDYALLCSIFDYLYKADHFFGTRDIIKLFGKKPWLKLINRKVIQKKLFDTLEEEIKEAVRMCDVQDLKRAIGFLTAYKSSNILGERP
ncbi:MAG: glycosyltransferase family protein [Thermodesulfovibrionales bacterium]